MTCSVCAKPVETDADYNYEGTRVIHVLLQGVSIRCAECWEFVHVECATGEICNACMAVLA